MSEYDGDHMAAHPVAANPADSPLIEAMVSPYAWENTEITYAFVGAGEPTFKGPYPGGSDVTSAWSKSERDVVEDIFAHTESLINVTFTKTSVAASDMDYQLVEDAPGGFAGYAEYPSAFFGSTTVLDDTWVDPATSNTVVHELGHAMGLEHPHDGNNVFPGVRNEDDPGPHGLNNKLFSTESYVEAFDPLRPDLDIDAMQMNFMALDIAALQEIYGANMDTAKGKTTYTQTEYLISIWDAGGTDTIDFTATNQDSVIDLRAATLENAPGGGGYFSFVYVDDNYTTGGYTIAYDVTIENGFGGGGNDHIQGNHAGNTLKGNAGSDTVMGGDGDDTIKGGKQSDDLSGGLGNDTITGDKGDDMLKGDDGKDDLNGGGGKDTVKGGKGKDTVTGGEGKDTLFGNKGADQFNFYASDGKDKIKDFNADEDILMLDAALFDDPMTAAEVVDDYAKIKNGDAVLTFDDATTLKLIGFGEDYSGKNKALNALEDALDIF